jgi:hypothetical protein
MNASRFPEKPTALSLSISATMDMSYETFLYFFTEKNCEYKKKKKIKVQAMPIRPYMAVIGDISTFGSAALQNNGTG